MVATTNSDYKTRLARINDAVNQELRSSRPDPIKIKTIVSELQQLDSDYDKRSPAELAYKIAEIQACIYFLRGDYQNARKFADRAITKRGESYSRIETLIKLITIRQRKAHQSALKAARKKASRKIVFGLGCVIVGIIIVELIAKFIHSNKPQPTIPSTAVHFNGKYFVMLAAIIIGGWQFINGSKELLHIRRMNPEIFNSNQ